MMMMSMWYVILVPFFILMVVVGTSRRNNDDNDEEIEVDSTDQGEEEGITHLCGSMSQGLGEVKGWNHKIYMSPLSFKIHRFLYPCEKAYVRDYVLG